MLCKYDLQCTDLQASPKYGDAVNQIKHELTNELH